MMATLSLSPKRALEKLRQHRHAVAVLALHRAKKAVERDLRSKGIRTTLIRPAEISLLARDYLVQHQERLRAEAEHAIATWPGFAHWRLPHNLRMSQNQLLLLCKSQVPNDRHRAGNSMAASAAIPWASKGIGDKEQGQ